MHLRMQTLPDLAWVGIAGVAVLSLLAVLYTLAETVRCGMAIHDAQVRKIRRRIQYAEALAAEQEEVILVEEAPLPPQVVGTIVPEALVVGQAA
jgi:hypothetical protein